MTEKSTAATKTGTSPCFRVSLMRAKATGNTEVFFIRGERTSPEPARLEGANRSIERANELMGNLEFKENKKEGKTLLTLR